MQAYFPLFFLFFSFGFFMHCNGPDSSKALKNMSKEELKEPLIKANKKLVQNEDVIIDAYLERHKLKMTETGTGLRYLIYQKGSGMKAEAGQMAAINYKVFLLDGTLLYSSSDKGSEEFLIGQDQKESGLHEGIQYMRVGDKAKMILPSHLAYGLLGDEKKIQGRAVIVYDVELVSLR